VAETALLVNVPDPRNSLAARNAARTSRIKSRHFQQSKALSVFFARRLMQNNNFA
jgi:hypothetical protein